MVIGVRTVVTWSGGRHKELSRELEMFFIMFWEVITMAIYMCKSSPVWTVKVPMLYCI